MVGSAGFDKERLRTGGVSPTAPGGAPITLSLQGQNMEAEIAGLHRALGEADALRGAGKLQAARGLLEQLVSRSPEYFAAWNMLGALHHAQGNLLGAAACFQRAAIINSDDLGVVKNLSQCYALLGAHELSEATIKIVQARSKEDLPLLMSLGRIANLRFDHQAATAYFSQACNLDDKQTEARFALADAYFYMGSYEEALGHYLKALAVEKSGRKRPHVLSGIIYALSQTNTDNQKIDLLAEIDQLTASHANIDQEDAVPLKFARGLALEKRGDFAEAWKALSLANGAIWQARGGAEYKLVRERNTLLLAAAKAFPALRDRPIDGEAPRAVFIAGPSRSGKSTLEKLLAGAGLPLTRGFEAGLVEQLVARASQECDLPTIRQLQALPKGAFKRFSELLEAEVARLANGMKIVTDTHPSNLSQAGHVVKAYRNSVFLFVVRDIDDNAVRCFQKMYESGTWYSYDIDACRDYLEYCRNIAAAWVERLPGRAVMVSYEEMVGEPRRVLERVSQLIAVDLTASNEAPYDDRFAARPYRDFMLPQR